MNKGFAVVIGMTIAYAASLIGMIFAYMYYKKYRGKNNAENQEGREHV